MAKASRRRPASKQGKRSGKALPPEPGWRRWTAWLRWLSLANLTLAGAAVGLAFVVTWNVIGKRSDVINRVVPDVLEMVGLSGKANRLPSELSGGEQQRVAIARAFVNRPLVLLADEPTGNLDPETSEGIMLLLERINRTGTTVIMATHDYHIVDSMRRRVIELNGGVITRDQSRGVYGVGR